MYVASKKNVFEQKCVYIVKFPLCLKNYPQNVMSSSKIRTSFAPYSNKCPLWLKIYI